MTLCGLFCLWAWPKTPEEVPYVTAFFMRLFRLLARLCGNDCADKDFIIIKMCASNVH